MCGLAVDSVFNLSLLGLECFFVLFFFFHLLASHTLTMILIGYENMQV